jgi:hypothetical protein
LKAISAKQKWDLNDVTVFNFDVAKIRFGTSQTYQFRIGSGKNNFTVKFSDQVSSWNNNKFTTPKPDLASLLNQLSSMVFLDHIKLEGPFELRVDQFHHLSLNLPVSHNSDLYLLQIHSSLFFFMYLFHWVGLGSLNFVVI